MKNRLEFILVFLITMFNNYCFADVVNISRVDELFGAKGVHSISWDLHETYFRLAIFWVILIIISLIIHLILTKNNKKHSKKALIIQLILTVIGILLTANILLKSNGI